MHFYYILPLLAGFLYALSALVSKQAIIQGGGAMRINFIANMLAVPCFAPFLLIDSQIIDPSHWWAPVACGIANFSGMSLTFATIRVGQVSILTPMLGTKILFVAILVTLLYQTPIPMAWWVAAFLAVAAIGLLGFSRPKHIERSTILKTMWLALLTTFSFAINDVIIAQEAQDFGEPMFLFIMMCITALCSFAFIPFFRGGLFAPSKTTWKWVLTGAFLMVLVMVCFFAAVAFYGNPTAMNILYSSRGIFGIVLVWTVGHWFKNTEKEAGHRLMRRRLLGAVLLFVAIVIVLGTGE